MTTLRSLACTTAVLPFLATGAAAQVSAEGLWDEWQSMYADAGVTLEAGSREMSGGTLTLSEVEVSFDMPEGTATGTIERIVLGEQDDGTVRITMSDRYDMDLSMKPEDAAPFEMALNVAAPGLVVVASGEGDTTSYTYDAPSLTVEVAQVETEGEALETDMDFVLQAVEGTYSLTEGTPIRFDSAFAAESLTVDISASATDGSGDFTMNGAFSDIASSSEGTLQDFVAMSDPDAALSGALDVSGTYTHGGGSYTLDVSGEESMTISSSSDTGALDFAFTGDSVRYGGANTGVEFTVSGAAIPFPQVSAAIEETAFGLTIPVAQSDEASDFALLLNLSGLTVGDELWSMIDPTGQIPRDPATLLLDLSGRAKVLVDVSDPEAMTGAGAPAQVESVNINALTLALGGAELTGEGAFTFEGDAMPGMPAAMPEGSVQLTLSGANALLETLVQMGLVPQQQAMGAQMMLGMFAREVDDDQFESLIEVSPEGGITANGQRIQ